MAKLNNTIALEVLCGKWGSGKTRKKNLIKAGYNYDAIQKIVNDRMKKKSIDTVAKEVIKGLWGNNEVRKKCLTVAGYNYKTVQNRVNEILEQGKTLIDKEIDACITQANWMKNYKYEWENNPTVPKSKYKGTCVTYVACVLQRIGILKSGEDVWINTKGKVVGANSKMEVTYMKGTLASNKAKFKRGDIIIGGNGNPYAAAGSHIFILTGKWSGNNPYIYDQESANRVKAGKVPQHTWTGSFPMIALIRLKTSSTKTKQKKMTEWAKKIAKDNTYHYKVFTDDKKTQLCPICENYPVGKYHGYNCIGLCMAVWRHGAGLKNICNCGTIYNQLGDKMLKMTDADLQATVKSHMGIKEIKVIRNTKGIPKKEWKEGDLCMQFNGNTYQHMFYYCGNGKIVDSISPDYPINEQIAERDYKNYSAKIIIRYTGNW